MIIGVPREIRRHEHRVGLNPFAVSRLVQSGHSVLIESRAGDEARFRDVDYDRAGGSIVYDTDEVYQRADMVCRIGSLSSDEVDLLKPGTILCAFHHLAIAPRETVERLEQLACTVLGYEIVRDAFGTLSVLHPFSEMGGQMALDIAAYYLQNEQGGRGILIGNVPGVPPPTVLILGAGTVGSAAARRALASGAHVIVMDSDIRKLITLHDRLGGQAITVVSAMERLEQYTAIADVVIGAVLVPGQKSPYLVEESMVKAMKPGSVIVDVSIDQGGCVETSRPTTPEQPTFIAHEVVHYCVPNMTANIARTASRALVNAALPYLTEIADRGLDRALDENEGLRRGLYLLRGNRIDDREVAQENRTR